MSKTIGIITTKNDLHGKVIAHLISKNQAFKIHIFESDCFSTSTLASLRISNDSISEGILTNNIGEIVQIADLDLVWWRRTRPKQIINANISDSEYIELINIDSEYTLFGLFYTCFKGTWINDPIKSIIAENKLIQLDAAKKIGLKIPETLISNSFDSIKEFSAQKKSIVKAVRGLANRMLKTSEYILCETNKDDVKHSPCIYQNFVSGTCHIRVFAFGKTVISAGYYSDKIDSRFGSEQKPYKVVLNKLEKTLVLSLLDELGLSMGIFDFKRDDNDNLIFLEINQQGQFMDIEWLLGVDVIKPFSDFLMNSTNVK